MKKMKDLITIVGVALVAAAIAQEMKKPEEEREWHGKVGGFVPYDFRMPTMEKFKEVYWNPDEPQIISSRVFGVGWAINFGRLYKMARECYEKHCCGEQGPAREA